MARERFGTSIRRVLVVSSSAVALFAGVVAHPALAGAAGASPACDGVHLPPIIVPGDVDRDGDVDIFDYNIVVRDFGKTGPNLQGDITHDGRVDNVDYQILLRTFGFRSPCP